MDANWYDNQLADPVDGFVPCYDIAGNLLFQHSMDAGNRWMLNDAAGKPMLAWNNRNHRFHTEYDALHRPVGSFVKGADPLDGNREIQFEKVIYGDTPNNGLTEAQKTQLNLRGKPYQHYDTAGMVVSKGRNPVTGADEAFDFKGNLLRSTRQLILDPKTTPDWSQAPVLEAEIFSSSTRYDALNRPIQMVAPRSNRLNTKLNVIRPGYNEANLLERMDLWANQANEPTALLNPNTATDNIVKNINYNAKGQRLLIDYGNNSRTTYAYDSQTFRLIRLLTTRTGAFAASPLLLVDSGMLQNLSYVYDPVGNITEIRDAALPVIFNNNEQVEPVSRCTYDALYRLIEAQGREHIGQTSYQPTATHDNDRDYPFQNLPNANDMQALRNYTERYEYDAVGNIKAMLHGDWNRFYKYEDSNNRLRATSLPGDAAGTYSAKYAYDEHGNMTQMPHLPLMQWDFKDQLQAASQQVRNDNTSEITYFVYDASGERVRKVTERQNGTLKNERIYLGGFEIYREYNGDGSTVTLERETLHVMDDKRRVALVETKTLEIKDGVGGRIENPVAVMRYQLDNHLGSASLELNQNGNVLSYEEYHPYGTTSYQAKSSVAEVSLKRYRYTSKERDEETGLCYHGARYYAPWLGRWTSSDPGGMVDGINLYSYVSNNPTMFIDSTGMEKEPSATQVQKWVETHPKKISELLGSPLTDKELHQAVIAAVREDQRKADEGKPTLKAVDPGCKPLPNQQKRTQEPEARSVPPGSVTQEEYEREGKAALGNLAEGKLAKNPIATALSAGTILRGGNPTEVSTQLDRAQGPAGMLSAAAGIGAGQQRFNSTSNSPENNPGKPTPAIVAGSGNSGQGTPPPGGGGMPPAPPPAPPAANAAQAQKFKAELAAQHIKDATRVGTGGEVLNDRVKASGQKSDPSHRMASFLTEAELSKAVVTPIKGGDGVRRTLVQVTDQHFNGAEGIVEYIIDSDGSITHQRFIERGVVGAGANGRVDPSL